MRSSTVFLLLIVAVAAANSFHVSHALHLPPAAGLRTAGACISSEREALLEFKRGISGDPAGRLASWHQGEQDCCRWHGVRCSNRTGHVVGLHLRNVHTAYDPEIRSWREYADEIRSWHEYEDKIEHTALTGQISPSLQSLHRLEHLDLSWNNISGPAAGAVPEFLGHLRNLRYLNLSGMPLSGRIPPQLGNLSNLHYLDLSPGLWDTNLYATDISWLSHLPLRYLDMDSVYLNMIEGWAHVVNTIPSLRVLRLRCCYLKSANESPPHLNLTNLEHLRLSRNHFDHPVASCWFWNVTSLQRLEFAETHVYGQIPDALGSMTSLEVLDFSSSFESIHIMTANMTNLCKLETVDFRGSDLDGNITELLGRLPQCSPNKLKQLCLSDNNFSGVLPNWIGRWTSLLILDLSVNQIAGPVPSEISMLRSLQILDLRENQLTGPVPSEISMLRSLQILDLHENQLTGPVPSEIGTLSNLIELDLNDNSLEGLITHEHFAGLTKLKDIDLSANSLNIVVAPEWLPPFSLKSARLSSCRMGPQFPVWLQYQVDILYLDISNTSIFDRLPDWFASTFSKAIYLDISNNGINGTLPTKLDNMRSLQDLYLYSNNLTGQIPQLPANLYILDISTNYLSGPLPSNLGATDLRILILFSNRITGHVPRSICELNLKVLSLGNNCLEGEFPQCSEARMTDVLILKNNTVSAKLESILETYTELQILDLSWNKVTGSIPATITKLGNLSYLNLAGNTISGAIPSHFFSNLTSMQAENPYYLVGDGNVIVPVTMKGQERYYYHFASYDMVSIDLSSNQLTGGIPEEIVSLVRVMNLNLSRNNLTGQIPEKIGVIHLLESLDLSGNMISGEITQSLSNLTYLSFLDLSDNNLTGRIPSGVQLESIFSQDMYIYDGNIGLCGYPLRKNCTSNSDKEIEERDSKVLTFSFGLGMGYVVGLWVVFCVTLFKGSWRLAYFQLFDKAFDKVYVFLLVTWARWAKKTPNHSAN